MSPDKYTREDFIIEPHSDCSAPFRQLTEPPEMFVFQKKVDPAQLERRQKAMAEKAIRNAERRSKKRR